MCVGPLGLMFLIRGKQRFAVVRVRRLVLVRQQETEVIVAVDMAKRYTADSVLPLVPLSTA